MRVSLKLRKGSEVKYLSHRDFIRAFEMALRRARIPVAYSEGFNPRPRMSFGTAIGVGVTSDDERIVLELNAPLSPETVKDELNACLPKGMQVLEAEALPEGVRRVALDISCFCVEVEGATEDIKPSVIRLLQSKEIRVTREKEGVAKESDIRPNVLAAEVVEAGKGLTIIHLALRFGDSGGARPQDFMQALARTMPNLKVRSIHRRAQFSEAEYASGTV